MRKELLEKIMIVSEEEKKILIEEKIDKEIYTSDQNFDVNTDKFMSVGEYITMRTHTRFVDFPLHGHDFIEVMYICNGSVTHIIDDKEIHMLPGDILFMNQRVRHIIKKTEISDVAVNFIIRPEFFDIPLSMMKSERNNLLTDFLIGTLGTDAHRMQYLHFKTRGNHEIENLMENIISSLLYQKEGCDNINQITMGLLFLHLLNSTESIDRNSFQVGRDVIANAAIQYINNRYKDANLTEFASSMHQSLSNVSKIIKKGTGHTFNELLTNKRFHQAVNFLVDTKMPVSEIISAVGYENSSYFYKKFREKYGISPKDYRSKYENKQTVESLVPHIVK